MDHMVQLFQSNTAIGLNSISIAQSKVDPKIWIFVLLLLALVGFGGILIFAIRRRLFEDRDNGPSIGGGIFEHLDQMKRDGTITQEEYDQTRSSIIERSAQQLKDEGSEKESP